MIPTLISSFAAAGKTWEMKMLVPSSLNFGATARIDEMWQLVNFLSGIMYPSSFQLRHFCWYFSHSRSVPCQGPVTNLLYSTVIPRFTVLRYIPYVYMHINSSPIMKFIVRKYALWIVMNPSTEKRPVNRKRSIALLSWHDNLENGSFKLQCRLAKTGFL